MSRSLRESSLLNTVDYRSLSVGVEPSIEYLIQTTIVGATPTATIEFDVSSYTGVYRHLQLCWALRSNRSENNSRALIRFNSDSNANYSNHYLGGGTTSTAFTGDTTPDYSTGVVSIDGVAGATGTAGAFGIAVIDILDAFNTNKYKTVRFLDGQAQSFTRISLNSGNWRSTSAITSITISDLYSTFVSGSRVSLYGVTA